MLAFEWLLVPVFSGTGCTHYYYCTSYWFSVSTTTAQWRVSFALQHGVMQPAVRVAYPCTIRRLQACSAVQTAVLSTCVCACRYGVLCIYVCTYVRTYVCMYVRKYVRMYVRKYVRMYVCMYVCIYVRTCVHTYIHTYVCMYVCTYVCMYACMSYVCMYVCTYVCIICVYVLCMYVLCMYVCMYVLCMYVCMYVRMNICVCARICMYVRICVCIYVCTYVCMHLTTLSRYLPEKLIVAQLVKKISRIFGTQIFINIFTTTVTCTYPKSNEQISRPPILIPAE